MGNSSDASQPRTTPQSRLGKQHHFIHLYFPHHLNVGLALSCSDPVSQRETLRPQQEAALPYSNVQGEGWTRSQILLPSYLPEAKEELN